MRRGWLIPAVLIAVAAAAPGAGASTLTIGPAEVRGYAMTIRVGSGDSEGVLTLARRRGGAVQTHTYRLTDVRYRMGRGLGRGRVRARLEGGGRIAMRWRATERRRTVRSPRGCSGRRQVRRGLLRGSLRLVLAQELSGTVVRRRLHGRAERAGVIHCAAIKPPRRLSLSALHVSAGRRLHVRAIRLPDGRAEYVFRYEGGDVAGVHRIHAIAGSLTAAPDLATGALRAGGPYLSGRLAFTATTPDDGAPGLARRGTLTGRLTVRFDGLTPVTIRTLGDATLRLR